MSISYSNLHQSIASEINELKWVSIEDVQFVKDCISKYTSPCSSSNLSEWVTHLFHRILNGLGQLVARQSDWNKAKEIVRKSGENYDLDGESRVLPDENIDTEIDQADLKLLNWLSTNNFYRSLDIK